MGDVTKLADKLIEKRLINAATASHDEVSTFLAARIAMMKHIGAPADLVSLAEKHSLQFDSISRKVFAGATFIRSDK